MLFLLGLIFELSLVFWRAHAPTMAPRISRSSSFATSSGSSAERPAHPSSGPSIGFCWPRQVGRSRASDGPAFWSPRPRSCVGTGSVKKKWTYGKTGLPGRPPIGPDVRDLVLRIARENPRRGCIRIKGELAKLGIQISATTIRNLLANRATRSWRRVGLDRLGRSSYELKRKGSSRATSSPSRPPGCGRSTSCCSSNSAAGVST